MIRKTVVSTLLALTAGAAVVVAAPASAEAVTGYVPNYFECSYSTAKCVQTNGAYASSVPTVCHGVYRAIWTGNRNPSLCGRWV